MQEKIIEIMKKFSEEENVDANTSIIQGLDSLSLISFILNVEDEADIEIDLDTLDIAVLESVEIFSSYIEGLMIHV